MLKTLTVIATALTMLGAVSVPAAQAQDAKPTTAQTCSAEWKDFKATNGKPAKGEGREVYQTFRKACTEKHGGSKITGTDKAALVAKIEAYKVK